jgi:hypothetical protein
MTSVSSEVLSRGSGVTAAVQTLELTRKFEDLVAVDHLSFSTASGSKY